MTFYLKIDENNIIRDAIEYPFEGYTEVHLEETHLPAGINGGWYRWNGATYELDEELKRQADERIKELRRQENTDIIAEVIDNYTLELIERGML
ncbi:hypothetical protein [Lutispora thermophila]|uniref:Uncharacterized protein n=1 Tax=Lutispora thermophila DSM 19022 TaxID=1122184 RepID=A0A1M6CR42_9FIRM|nr:hypothetical protein [Lutispora thermophila]SHI63440.1 hypothetical protein SAMN02745176_00903 [Lutispora thermophila DSM 19022]